MFPIQRIYEIFFGSAPKATLTADDAAFNADNLYYRVDGSQSTVNITLADPTKVGTLVVFEAIDVTNAVSVQVPIPGGTTPTWTPSVAGEMLFLLSNESGKYVVVSGTVA